MQQEQQSGPGSEKPKRPRAFEVLNAIRATVRGDTRPRFQPLVVPELGEVRIRRFQPEVLGKLRAELVEMGIMSPEQINGLDEDTREKFRLRHQALRVIQRSLVPPGSSRLLFAGPEGFARLERSLPGNAPARITRQILAFNEIFSTATK